MSLFKEWSPNHHSLAAIWHIGEDEDFFLLADSVRNGVGINHIKHPRRRIEHLAGRYLLQHLKEDFPLHHIAADIHDKPRLPGNQYFFSISHSFPYVAAVISDAEECGIDIQTWPKRIENIAHMFLGPDELLAREPKTLTLAWSAKEAAYKWHGRRGADFIRDLPIRLLVEESTLHPLPDVPEPFLVDMQCFGLAVQPKCFIYKDFALAYLVRHRPGDNPADRQ
jgi:phosphopantetheinyl transferase